MTQRNEAYHRFPLGTRACARFAVTERIEVLCYGRRKHFTLGCRSVAQAFGDRQKHATTAD